MALSEKFQELRDDLVMAMDSGAVEPAGKDLLQLAVDLTVFAFPEARPPKGLDAFTLIVGEIVGAALERYEYIEPGEDGR